MKIALIGISGRVGSRLANEFLQRGHDVIGIARDVSRTPVNAHLRLLQADATKAGDLEAAIKASAADVVVSASSFTSSNATALIAASKQAGIKRLMLVGGAGSLEVTPGKRVVDTTEFPDAYKPEARAGVTFLDTLRDEKHLDWTFISPPLEFDPGIRSGNYRFGTDQPVFDAHSRSWISMEDYAIAFADELESPRHKQQRFTVGY